MRKTAIPKATRRLVRERAGNRCEYCQSSCLITTDLFATDHIFPESRGGTSHESNLAFACSGCNDYKGVKIEGFDAETNGVVSLFHPRQDEWQTHFEWSVDTTLMVAKSAIGRVTIEILRMNRVELMALRQVLCQVGLHPPF